MKAKDFTTLLVLSAIWGASFLFVRIGSPLLGPFVLIELRVGLAFLALVFLTIIKRDKIAIWHKKGSYLLLGACNAAIPLCLIAYAELHLSAGLAAILNTTTPMMTAIVARLWTKEPFTTKKVIGVVLGIVGVAIVVGLGSNSSSTSILLPALLSLLATLFYGIGGVFSARHFKGEKPLDMAIGQQAGASLVLLPFSLLTIPKHFPSPTVWLSVLALALLCTAFAYLLYFGLIHRVGAVKTSTVTFLVPIFGVLWGYLFLAESIPLRAWLGLILILLSVALVLRGKK